MNKKVQVEKMQAIYDDLKKQYDLFDENTNLKVRNEYLESQLGDKSKTKMCVEDKSIKIDSLLNKLIDYGKDKLFNEVIKSGYSSTISVKENEKGSFETTLLDKWLENKMYTYNIPDNMSKEDIKNILCNEIQALYENEKQKAISEYLINKDKGEDNGNN